MNNKNAFSCPVCTSNKNTMKLTSKNKFSNKSKSPDLTWDEHTGAKSYALLCVDPDADNYRHWVLLNIPPDMTSLPASEVVTTQNWEIDGKTIIQGKNQHEKYGYISPNPPPSKVHRYYFCIYALDTDLTGSNNNNGNVYGKIEDHVLACGHCMIKYPNGNNSATLNKNNNKQNNNNAKLNKNNNKKNNKNN